MDKVEYIYRKYYSLMRYIAGRVLERDGQDADDAVHDAMIKIIKNADVIDVTDPDRLKNFCCIIARNSAADRLRTKEGISVPFCEMPEDIEDGGPLPEQAAISEEEYEVMLEAFSSLPDTYRDACVLKYFHKLKEREIALILGIPIRTVSTKIRRGKMLLRETLRKEGVHE